MSETIQPDPGANLNQDPPQTLATQDPATPMGDPGEQVVNDAPLPRTVQPSQTMQGTVGDLQDLHDDLGTLQNHVSNNDQGAAHAFIANMRRRILALIEAVNPKQPDVPAVEETPPVPETAQEG